LECVWLTTDLHGHTGADEWRESCLRQECIVGPKAYARVPGDLLVGHVVEDCRKPQRRLDREGFGDVVRRPERRPGDLDDGFLTLEELGGDVGPGWVPHIA